MQKTGDQIHGILKEFLTAQRAYIFLPHNSEWFVLS